MMPSPYAGNGVLRPRQVEPALAAPELPHLRLTAGVPSKDVLSLVTLSWTGKHLRLVPTSTAFFHLASEDQQGLQRFADEVYAYLAARQISFLVVRRGPGTGPQSVSTGTTAMETVLKLMPVPCLAPHTQRVLAWVNSAEWLLPLPQNGYRAERRRLQTRAIETAAFAIAKILEACSERLSPEPPVWTAGALIDAA